MDKYLSGFVYSRSWYEVLVGIRCGCKGVKAELFRYLLAYGGWHSVLLSHPEIH